GQKGRRRTDRGRPRTIGWLPHRSYSCWQRPPPSPQTSDVVGLRRTNPDGRRFLPPPPPGDLGHVVAVAADVLFVRDQLIADRLLGVGRAFSKLRDAIDHVADQVKAIKIVEHAHVEWCRGGAFFLVAAYVNVLMACSPVGQPVNEPRVAMEGEDDRLVRGE